MVQIEMIEVPNGRRIRIRTNQVPLFRNRGLDAPWRKGMLKILGIEHQLRTYVAALARINAPKIANSFGVLGIFADTDVNQSLIDYRGADDMVSRRLTADGILRCLGIAVE